MVRFYRREFSIRVIKKVATRDAIWYRGTGAKTKLSISRAFIAAHDDTLCMSTSQQSPGTRSSIDRIRVYIIALFTLSIIPSSCLVL